jgi:hypothetical protein
MSFKEQTKEDVRQYRDFIKRYSALTTEDCSTAFDMTKEALVLADRWIDLQAQANKEAARELGTTKSDLSQWCYAHYRQLHLAFEHCRVIWNNGERFNKEIELIDRRRQT